MIIKNFGRLDGIVGTEGNGVGGACDSLTFATAVTSTAVNRASWIKLDKCLFLPGHSNSAGVKQWKLMSVLEIKKKPNSKPIQRNIVEICSSRWSAFRAL